MRNSSSVSRTVITILAVAAISVGRHKETITAPADTTVTTTTL